MPPKAKKVKRTLAELLAMDTSTMTPGQRSAHTRSKNQARREEESATAGMSPSPMGNSANSASLAQVLDTPPTPPTPATAIPASQGRGRKRASDVNDNANSASKKARADNVQQSVSAASATRRSEVPSLNLDNLEEEHTTLGLRSPTRTSALAPASMLLDDDGAVMRNDDDDSDASKSGSDSDVDEHEAEADERRLAALSKKNPTNFQKSMELERPSRSETIGGTIATANSVPSTTAAVNPVESTTATVNPVPSTAAAANPVESIAATVNPAVLSASAPTSGSWGVMTLQDVLNTAPEGTQFAYSFSDPGPSPSARTVAGHRPPVGFGPGPLLPMASHPLATDIPSIPTASQGAMVLPPSQPSDFNLPGTDLVQPPPDRRDSRLRTTDQHKPVQQSVKLSFPEIRVNVALVNPFPDSPTSMAWAKHALLVGAGRAANGSHVLARMQQQPEYTRALSPLTIARICHFRADIKSITDHLITTEFDLGVPSTPGYNDKVHKLLKDYNYIFPHSASGAIRRQHGYQAEIGIKVMHAAIFADGFAAEYQDRFPRRVNASTGEIEYAVTKSFVAVCYTGVYASLNDKTKAADPPPPIIPGKKAKSNKYEFSSDNYLDVYRGHMLSLDAGEVQRGEDGFHVFMHDLYMKASTYGTTAVQAAAPNIKTAPIDWVIQDGPESDVDASE